VIANAKAEEVPKATIENAIKRATNVSDQQELIYEMQGPGNVIWRIGELKNVNCRRS
jgi:transcriptional/translational regulatory protein YebC/TACO1